MRAALVVVALGLALLAGAAVSTRNGADTPRLSTPDRDAAVAAIRLFLSLSTHLARSGGDERFADRIAAAPEVVEEVMAGLAFIRHSGWTEDPQLVRMDVETVEPGIHDTVEVVTKEYWVVRAARLRAGTPEPKPHVDVVRVRYNLQRDGAGWRIASWAIERSSAAMAAGQGG